MSNDYYTSTLNLELKYSTKFKNAKISTYI